MQPKWFNAERRRNQEFKYAMWTKYRDSMWGYACKQEYVSARNKCTEVYRKAKLSFEEKLAKTVTEDSKSFYSYVRSKSKVKDAFGPLVNSSGKTVTNKLEMYNLLNEFFGSVFKDESTLGEIPHIDQLFHGKELT